VAGNLVQGIADTRKRLADTQAQVEAPFEYAERLGFLTRRQREIEEQLDLTKGQAPSRLEAEPESSGPGVEAENEHESVPALP